MKFATGSYRAQEISCNMQAAADMPRLSQTSLQMNFGLGCLRVMNEIIRRKVHHLALSHTDMKPALRILHRSLCTRSCKDPMAPCLLCGEAQARLSHLARCHCIMHLFETFFKHYKTTPYFIYQGLNNDNAPLKEWVI